MFRRIAMSRKRPTITIALATAIGMLHTTASSCQPIQSETSVATVKRMGGKIVIDQADPRQPVIAVDLSMARVSDRDLAVLSAFPELRILDLEGGHFSDGGMKQIAALTSLKELSLARTAITEDGLKALRGLVQLRKLDLTATPITAKGVAVLAGLHNLEELVLDRTGIANQLDSLGPLKGLKTLSLAELQRPIRDAKTLVSLSSLEELDLSRLETTPDLSALSDVPKLG